MEPTFCTGIAPGIALSLVISADQPLAPLGNRLAAFVLGGVPTGLHEEFGREVRDFQGFAPDLDDGETLADHRWVDDQVTAEAVDSPDQDDMDLKVISPWGVYEEPGRPHSIALFLRREPRDDDLRAIQHRVRSFLERKSIGPVRFRMLRQVVTVELRDLGTLGT